MKTLHSSEFNESASWGSTPRSPGLCFLHSLPCLILCSAEQTEQKKYQLARAALHFSVYFIPTALPQARLFVAFLTGVPRAIQQLLFASVFCMSRGRQRMKRAGLSLTVTDLLCQGALLGIFIQATCRA